MIGRYNHTYKSELDSFAIILQKMKRFERGTGTS